MKIPRLSLLAALKAAEPALASSNNQLEVLSHFWFHDNVVAAFDGAFGVRVGFEADFTGGVLGSKLIGVLEKSRARNVELKVAKDDNLLLEAGTARVTFALKPIEEWIWNPEPPDEDGRFKVTADFIEAVRSVLFSVGVGKVLSPEQRGVVAIQNGIGVDLYSTDAVSLSLRKVKTGKTKPLSADSRVILPTLFCEQLCKVASEGFSLLVDEQSVYCAGKINVGDQIAPILLFSQLIDDDDPVNFEEVMSQYTKVDGRITEPGRLKMALERVMVLLANGETADFGIDKDGDDCYLSIKARSPYGEVDDEFKVEGDHPNIKVKIDAALLRRGLGGDKKEVQQTLSITPDCVLITGPDNFWHVVATK
jgi:hypothetical protein